MPDVDDESDEATEVRREVHNRLAPELIKRIIAETDNPVEASIILESLIVGVMMAYHVPTRVAVPVLATILASVIERMDSSPDEQVIN